MVNGQCLTDYEGEIISDFKDLLHLLDLSMSFGDNDNSYERVIHVWDHKKCDKDSGFIMYYIDSYSCKKGLTKYINEAIYYYLKES